jgi:hypothetical protein
MFSLLILAGWLVQLVALGGSPPSGAMRAALLFAGATTVFLAAHFGAWLWHVTPADATPDLAAALASGPGRVEAVRIGLAFLSVWAKPRLPSRPRSRSGGALAALDAGSFRRSASRVSGMALGAVLVVSLTSIRSMS